MNLFNKEREQKSLEADPARRWLPHSVLRFMGTFPKSLLNKLDRDLTDLSKKTRWSLNDSILLLPLHDYSKRELSVIGKMPEDWALINRKLHTLVL